MGRRRVNKKAAAKKKPSQVDDNEEAFLNFVNQNAQEPEQLNEPEEEKEEEQKEEEEKEEELEVEVVEVEEEKEEEKEEEFEPEMEAGASSSSSSYLSESESESESDQSYSSEDFSSDSSDESLDRRGRRRHRRRKYFKKGGNLKNKSSSRGLRSSSRHKEGRKKPRREPWYNEQELRASLAVIQKVMKMDEAEVFNVPLDPVALGIPDYFDVSDTPMDFGTICSNLQSGVKYMNSEDVFEDVQFIWKNCRKYNKKDDYVLDLMRRVKKKFMKYWTSAGLYSEQTRRINDHSIRRNRQNSRCLAGPMIGSLRQKQQDKLGLSQRQSQSPSLNYSQLIGQPQSQHTLLRNSQPYQLQQPHPSTSRPQPSQSQTAGNNSAGHSHVLPSMDYGMRRKKYVAKYPVGPMAGRPSLSQRQLNYNQPQASRDTAHSSLPPPVDYANDNAGHSHLAPPVDNDMRRKKYMPKYPVGPMINRPSQSQPQQSQLSYTQIFRLQQLQQSGNQLQSSQPQAGRDTVTAGQSPTNSVIKCNNYQSRCPVDPMTNNRSPQQQVQVGSGEPQPQAQQLSESYNRPCEMEQHRQRKKRGRGPTRCLQLWGLRDGERIDVSVNRLGQPIGPEASKLTNFLGTIARDGNMAPLTYVAWTAVPDAAKEDMWQMVQTKFNINPSSKSWVLKSLGGKWRDWKAKLKAKHYNPHETNEERLKDCDMRVLPDQWSILVSYWNSEEGKERSATNKANRAKQKDIHTTGTKSYARLREEEREKRPNGEEPTRDEFYVLTHTRKDGKPVNEAVASTISKLRERATQQPKTPEDCNNLDDVFCQVMGGDRPGRVRTYGLGLTPADVWGPTPSRSEVMRIASEAKRTANEDLGIDSESKRAGNEEISKMVEKMEAMEQRYANMEAQLSTMTSFMQRFLEGQHNPLGAKQVPDTSNAPEDSAQLHSSSSSHMIPSN